MTHAWQLQANAAIVKARYDDFEEVVGDVPVSRNNLFDRQYAQSQYNEGQQWILGEPRSFFVTADYTF